MTVDLKEESTITDIHGSLNKWFTLTYMALVVVARTLWNQEDIRDLIFNFPLILQTKIKITDKAKWQFIEDKVIEKAKLLILPVSLKSKVEGLIKPIGLEIYSFCKCFKSSPFDNLHLPRQLSWTPHGILDGRKTAESLIKDERIDIIKRYEIACVFCLEDFIPELWKEIPVGCKESFYNLEDPKMVFQHRKLVVFWTYHINGDGSTFLEKIRRSTVRNVYNLSLLQWILMYSAENDLKVATEYFLEKLTPIDREASLFLNKHFLPCFRVTGVYRGGYGIEVCDVFYSLFSCPNFISTTNEFVTSLKCFAFEILKSSLHWPRQYFFLNTATHLPSLDEYSFSKLLKEIVQKIKDGYRDWDYLSLFKGLWKKGTTEDKRYVLKNNCLGGGLLMDLLKLKDLESALLILQNAAASDLEDLFLYRRDIVCILMYNNGWEVFQLLALRSMRTKETINEFEKEFRNRDITITAKEYISEEKVIVRNFFKALKDLLGKPKINWSYALYESQWKIRVKL